MLSDYALELMKLLAEPGADFYPVDDNTWQCDIGSESYSFPDSAAQELINHGFIDQGDEPLFRESPEVIEDAIDENVKLGYMRDNGDGTFSITPSGEAHILAKLKRG